MGALEALMTTVSRPLHRSRSRRIFGGVCAGLAQWLGWDVGVVRLAYVLVSILSAAFPGLLVYLILWIAMPLEQP
jgi:phage shock protein PspC (stress-responsive transcriptional regulator)